MQTSRTISRRSVMLAGGGAAALAGYGLLSRAGGPAAAATRFPVEHTDAEWRKLLTPAQFDILRRQGTEAPFTSPLLNEHRKGVFACVACSQPLYSSATKFDSGTGWPSFYAPLPHAISTENDHSMLMDRTEMHCGRCGGHLGHVFDDGPRPTGLRYCMDGVAMKFLPA